MERYKIYGAVHKGLRNGLSQLLFLAGNTDYADKTSVEKMYKLGTKLFKLMSSHAEDENNIMLAPLAAKMNGAGAYDIEEHEFIEAKQHDLEQLLTDVYEVAKGGDDAAKKGEQFFTDFTTFCGEYFLHMVHEETVTQQQLWDNFTDEELIGFTQQIVSKIPMEKTLDWYSFMLPAMNPAERTGLYKTISVAMPAEIFKAIDAGIKQFLTDEDYLALKKSVSTVA